MRQIVRSFDADYYLLSKEQWDKLRSLLTFFHLFSNKILGILRNKVRLFGLSYHCLHRLTN